MRKASFIEGMILRLNRISQIKRGSGINITIRANVLASVLAVDATDSVRSAISETSESPLNKCIVTSAGRARNLRKHEIAMYADFRFHRQNKCEDRELCSCAPSARRKTLLFASCHLSIVINTTMLCGVSPRDLAWRLSSNPSFREPVNFLDDATQNDFRKTVTVPGTVQKTAAAEPAGVDGRDTKRRYTHVHIRPMLGHLHLGRLRPSHQSGHSNSQHHGHIHGLYALPGMDRPCLDDQRALMLKRRADPDQDRSAKTGMKYRRNKARPVSGRVAQNPDKNGLSGITGRVPGLVARTVFKK